MATRSLSGNRTLTFASMGAPADQSIQPPFVTLLPAYSAPERQEAAKLTKKLIDLGCVEFCCVGPDAELLHDVLDEIIEDEDALEVVTTSIENLAEGSEYFLHAAAGGRANLLALSCSHPDLHSILEQEARRDSDLEPLA